MKNIFQVASVCYSDHDDSVIATAYLARSVLDPETEVSADDTLEVFEIQASFASREFVIRDLGDLQGESEPHYLPSVLTAFMRTFDVENCSELFRFEVPL